MSARDRLLEAAFGMFLAHGYDGTGLGDILGATGLSKGAFYHHFSSKEALFEEVIGRFFPSPFDSFDWTVHAALTAAGQRRAITALYAQLVSTSAAMGADMIRYFALFFESLSRLPAYRASIGQAYERLINCLSAAMLREGTGDVEAARSEARQFVAGQEGALYLWAVTGTPPESIGDK